MLTKTFRFLMTAAFLIGIWYLLSGKADLLHLGMGVVTAVLISARYYNFQRNVKFPVLRFVLYIPWLLIQVIQSNLHVAKLVFSRPSRISPRFVRQTMTGIDDERAQVVLGCSITLTPGTLTVNIDENSMLVHALDDQVADDLEEKHIERRVRRVFEESPA